MFRLMVATFLGDWTSFAQLTVARDDEVLDAPVAFDPVLNPLPGLPLAQPLRSLCAELAEQRRQWDTVVDALQEIWLGPGDVRPWTATPLEGMA